MMKILIVEDEVFSRMKLKKILNEFGECVAVESGIDALKSVEKDILPDIIILDILMPNMDGYEVCKQLKDNPRTKDIPVIFISGLINITDEIKGFEMGAVDYIHKPFVPILVKARVRTHIQLKYKSDLLDRLSLFDALTEIPNRRNFNITIEKEMFRALRNKKYISLILIDIDFFKLYNDHYGHVAGDLCLHKIAQAMMSVIKRSSDFLARYGGEEFIIILPELPIEKAMIVSESVRLAVDSLQIPHIKSTVSKNVTISLGVTSVLIKQEINPIELVQDADKALYLAKESGRNCVKKFVIE